MNNLSNSQIPTELNNGQGQETIRTPKIELKTIIARSLVNNVNSTGMSTLFAMFYVTLESKRVVRYTINCHTTCSYSCPHFSVYLSMGTNLNNEPIPKKAK